MMISSEDAKRILNIESQKFIGMITILRRAGVKIDTRYSRLKSSGHFCLMSHFDIEEAINAMEKRVKSGTPGNQYRDSWKNRLTQLKKVKREWDEKA